MNDQSTIDILTGSPLRERFAPEARLRKRDCFSEILEWLESGDRTVGILYGLRETGKATLIGQVINHLQEDSFAKAAYLLLNRDTDMREVRLTMRELYNNGFRLFFIDEATAPKDFIGSAALYSDIYAQSGAKVLLSGTDSLGFSLAKGDSLYDRCTLFHTSYIPYREFERVLDVHDIDKYIEYGGTMCISGTNDSRSVFRSRESTDEYVDSAIAMNIQHALEGYRDGGRMVNHPRMNSRA